MIALRRVIETVEFVDLWETLADENRIEDELFIDDEVLIGELHRFWTDRERLAYQRDGLIAMFPNRVSYYQSVYQMQVKDLEKRVVALLPDHVINQIITE